MGTNLDSGGDPIMPSDTQKKVRLEKVTEVDDSPVCCAVGRQALPRPGSWGGGGIVNLK